MFTEDVVYDLTGFGAGDTTLHGLDSLVSAGRALGAGNPVGHHVTNPVIEADADGRLRARSKGIGIRADGTCGSVTYEDVLVRGAGGWRVAQRRVRARRAPLGG